MSMLYLSEILMQHHDVNTFAELCEVIQKKAEAHMFFKIDVKPPYPDTPANWEDKLEGAFVGVHSITHGNLSK